MATRRLLADVHPSPTLILGKEMTVLEAAELMTSARTNAAPISFVPPTGTETAELARPLRAAWWRVVLLVVLGRDDAACALATGTGCTEAHEANFCYVHVPLTERLAGGAYGTRTSTAVLVAADGGVTVVERDRADGGWAEQALVFPAA